MSAPKIISVNGVRYMRVDAAHPIEDTEGVPLSDIGKKSEPAVQKALKDSRDMYFTQKGGDKKKPKETGINPDTNQAPGAGFDAGDGDGDGGDGGGGE